MVTSEYTVTGMTCGHCVAAVRQEIGKIDGVERVDIDVSTGRLSVSSGTPVDAAVVVAAVDEAGYHAVPVH
jgi:copper chaperone CopZ